MVFSKSVKWKHWSSTKKYEFCVLFDLDNLCVSLVIQVFKNLVLFQYFDIFDVTLRFTVYGKVHCCIIL